MINSPSAGERNRPCRPSSPDARHSNLPLRNPRPTPTAHNDSQSGDLANRGTRAYSAIWPTRAWGTSAQPRTSHGIADHEWRCWPLHKNAMPELAHIGIMWVTFGHLRPSGHIMPDHAGDRGAVFLVLAPHDHLAYQAESDAPAWSLGLACTRWRRGLREVDGRYLRGTPQVDHGHEPCWQVRCPDGPARNAAPQLTAVSLAPLSSSGNRACQRTAAGPCRCAPRGVRQLPAAAGGRLGDVPA